MKRILHYLPHAALLVLLGWLAFPTVLPLLEPGDSGHHLHAQEVYTDLTDPEQIRVFTEVSDGLICQCGCHFVLSSCPHVECPWGIPVRRFMEIKIQEGMSAKEILAKMETGFGPEIREYPLVQRYLKEGREDVITGLERGYGPGVSAHASPFGLIAILLFTAITASLLFSYWWKRNRGKQRPTSPGAQESPGNDSRDNSRNNSGDDSGKDAADKKQAASEGDEEWETRLRDLDR
ncbi:MAG: hypothetical protein NXI24_04855 [bacterium]|nr:hypothetical protein [bacterium]